jgi:hypothetical protein
MTKVTTLNKNALTYAFRVFGLKSQNEFGKPRKIEADQSKSLFLDFSKSGVLLGISANTVVSSLDGNVKKFTLTHSLTLLQSTSGLTKYY